MKPISFSALIMSILLTGQAVIGLEKDSEILSLEEYSAIHDVGERIISQYPPDQYLYVGIGRSPTPFIAYLEAKLGETFTMHLPLGNFRSFKPGNLSYTQPNQDILDSYLEGYIQSGLSKNKKLLFIDYAISGASLVNLKKELERNANSSSIQILALTNPRGVPARAEVFNTNNIPYLVIPISLHNKLAAHGYDNLSKYESLRVMDDYGRFSLPREPILKPKLYGSLVSEIQGNLFFIPKSCSNLFAPAH